MDLFLPEDPAQAVLFDSFQSWEVAVLEPIPCDFAVCIAPCCGTGLTGLEVPPVAGATDPSPADLLFPVEEAPELYGDDPLIGRTLGCWPVQPIDCCPPDVELPDIDSVIDISQDSGIDPADASLKPEGDYYDEDWEADGEVFVASDFSSIDSQFAFGQIEVTVAADSAESQIVIGNSQEINICLSTDDSLSAPRPWWRGASSFEPNGISLVAEPEFDAAVLYSGTDPAVGNQTLLPLSNLIGLDDKSGIASVNNAQSLISAERFAAFSSSTGTVTTLDASGYTAGNTSSHLLDAMDHSKFAVSPASLSPIMNSDIFDKSHHYCNSDEAVLGMEFDADYAALLEWTILSLLRQ